MKRVVFNFLVLQLVIWSVVFSEGLEGEQTVNYASISDSWEVAKIEDQQKENIVLHYPTFNKLTLNSNGTFERLVSDDLIESGNWYVNSPENKLTLIYKSTIEEFDIIQLPSAKAESFIIKEKNPIVANRKLKYELTRL